MPARAGAERIPEHLRVHVGVAVDKAGRHDVAFGVDHLAGRFADFADRGDSAAGDSDVGAKARHPRAVDNNAHHE